MRSVRSVIACLLLVWSRPVLGQQPTPAPQTPVFRGGIDLVTLDVRVVDKDGTPVVGLTPDDFTVLLDGQPRPVRALDFLTFGSGTATPATPVGSAAPAASAAVAPPTPPPAKRGGRVFLFLVDDVAARTLEAKELTTSAERMLATLDPADMVGLAATSGFVPTVNPTRDRAQILTALRSKDITGRADPRQSRPFVTVNEAIAIVRNLDQDLVNSTILRECGTLTDAKCTSMVKGTAHQLEADATRTRQQQLSVYSQAITALQQAPAPRILIVLTTGTPLSPYEPSPLKALSDAAARADVGFYSLVVSDLTGVDLSDAGGAGVAELRAEARRTESSFLFDNAKEVAQAAGGDAIRAIGQPDRILHDIVTETSALYRLGVEAPSGTDPAHLIGVRVTVNRPGASVRTNLHALMPTPAPPLSTADAMKQRLDQGGDAPGVAIHLSTDVRKDAGARIQLLTSVEMPAASPGPLTTMFALVNSSGAIVQSGTKDLSATPNEDYHLSVPFVVDEGDYHLRVVAADANGTIGSLDRSVAAHLHHLGPLAASDVLLTTSGPGGVQQLLPNDALPAAASELHVTLELYADTLPSDVTVRLSVATADGLPVLDDEVTPVARDGRLTAAGGIPAGVLPAGHYVVSATVLRAGDELGTLSAKFEKPAK